MPKDTIKRVVTDYKTQFAGEYSLIKEILKEKRKLVVNKYGLVDELSGSEMRALFEIPETLSQMLLSQLNDEEQKWFDSKTGARWFVKTYPEFQLPRDV